MFVNRRFYEFQPSLEFQENGILTLQQQSALARKTGRSKEALKKIDTMTGKKQVAQFYDEFESLDPRWALSGNPDEPAWLEKK